MSIKPIFAKKIFEGSKTVELRRTRPKALGSGSLVYVYVSHPICSISGIFFVDRVEEHSKIRLWNTVKNIAGLSYKEFCTYFDDKSKGIGIFISKTQIFKKPLKLQILRDYDINYRPPQSFRYLANDEKDFIKANIRECV